MEEILLVNWSFGDKSVYIYNDGEDDTVFLQFVTHNNKCGHGDPSGKISDFKAALHQFIDEADVWGYKPFSTSVMPKA